MMKSLLSFIVAAVLGAGLSAQAQSSSAPPAPSKDKGEPVVLNGCVSTSAPGTFVVQDEKKGRFELTGQKLDIYVGKRVQVRGSSEKGLHITTGLYPSPNVAAQAGAIDPVRAAQAAMPGSPDHQGNPTAPMPKITVTQVKTVKGDCK
jgi:hypothetical protein